MRAIRDHFANSSPFPANAMKPQAPLQLGAVFAILIVTLVPSRKCCARETGGPTEEQLAVLYATAVTQKPTRFYATADIERSSEGLSVGVVKRAVELATQGGNQNSTQKEALVRSLSAPPPPTIQHVREWYSKHYYRCDYSDIKDPAVTLSSEWDRSNGPLKRTLAEIQDHKFSDVYSYSINHPLKAVLVHYSPAWRWEYNDLWSVMSMEEPLLLPVLHALGEIEAPQIESLITKRFDTLNTIPISRAKVARIKEGSEVNWKIIISQNDDESTLYRLSGTFTSGGITKTVSASYEIKTVSDRHVLTRGRVENAPGVIYESTRSRISTSGVPRVLSRYDSAQERRLGVYFRALDYSPSFSDREIFLPPTPDTHPDYRFKDVTLESEVKRTPAGYSMLQNRRRAVIGTLIAITLVTIVAFRSRPYRPIP